MRTEHLYMKIPDNACWLDPCLNHLWVNSRDFFVYVLQENSLKLLSKNLRHNSQIKRWENYLKNWSLCCFLYSFHNSAPRPKCIRNFCTGQTFLFFLPTWKEGSPALIGGIFGTTMSPTTQSFSLLKNFWQICCHRLPSIHLYFAKYCKTKVNKLWAL